MKITIRQPLCFSEIGRKDNQEDCIYPSAKSVSTKNRFFVLCDGMGGMRMEKWPVLRYVNLWESSLRIINRKTE